MSILDYVASITSGVRFSKFFGVGVFGAVVDNISLVIFVEYVIINPLPAKILAAEVSIIVMLRVS
jgi:putative flippase GtrA